MKKPPEQNITLFYIWDQCFFAGHAVLCANSLATRAGKLDSKIGFLRVGYFDDDMRDANWQTFWGDKSQPWWCNMSRIFVGGSISIKQIPDAGKGRVANMVESGFAILVGDANGVDAAIQRFLAEQNYGNVCVYCSGKLPRNNLGRWPVSSVESGYAAGTREFFTEKDLVMAREADYGLMIWDMESTGTLGNVLELIGVGKKCVVYLQPRQAFLNVGDIVACKGVVGMMTEAAFKRADQKMGLQKRLVGLEAVKDGLF